MAQIKISELNSADTLNNNDLIPVINGGDTKSTTIAQLKEKMDIPDTSNLATLSTAQTISGKKTFSTLPESSVTPTGNDQLANKNYVDNAIATAITTTLGGSY